MKKLFVIAVMMMVVQFACGAPAPTAAPAPTTAPVIAQATTAPTTAPTMAPTTAPTMAASPTEMQATPTAQSSSVAIAASQNWNGKVNRQGYSYPVALAIVKVKGSSFSGVMVWSAPQCRVTTSVKGDIIQDITSATEQNRWALHADFQSGDKSGTWLRWTQIESIGSTVCYLGSMNDWWYAHIASNGNMTGIHFENSTDANPDSSVTFDFTLTSQ